MISGPHFELQYSVSFEEASALIDKIAKLLEAEFDKEYWLDIEGYQGHYRVSSMGRVRRMDRLFHDKKYGTVMRKGGVLELGRNSRGYLNVCLWKGSEKKWARVHELVLEAFVPRVKGKLLCNHKDGDKTNNRVENLEWCTGERRKG